MDIIYVGKPTKEYSQEMLDSRNIEYTRIARCCKCNTEVIVDTFDVYYEIYCESCGAVKL